MARNVLTAHRRMREEEQERHPASIIMVVIIFKKKQSKASKHSSCLPERVFLTICFLEHYIQSTLYILAKQEWNTSNHTRFILSFTLSKVTTCSFTQARHRKNTIDSVSPRLPSFHTRQVFTFSQSIVPRPKTFSLSSSPSSQNGYFVTRCLFPKGHSFRR